MVALASHQTAKKWTTETTISAAREKMHCRRGSHQPAQITSIECVVCKVWIAPLAILTLWSVGHHLAALTRLRQLLERKSFSPSVARAPALSVLVNSPYYHTHTRPKRRRRRRRFQKVKKPCVHMWASACWYVSVLSVNVYVFYTVLSIVSLCPTWSDAFSVGIRGQVCFSWNSPCSKSSLDSSVSLKNGCQS